MFDEDQEGVEFPAELNKALEQGKGAHAKHRAKRAAAELAKRQIEALRLYQATPIQNKFHSCRAKECLFQAGNQLGKSLAGFAEDARAVLGCDPYDKYRKTNGRLAIVGYKESHIQLNIYRYLFEPGQFKIIRDYDTGLWRTFHPWVPDDQERSDEALDAPPLIPDRFIKSIYWKSKVGKIFKRVELTTGWTIYAFSSTATPDQGFALDLAHIDEDIVDENWYGELFARLSMRDGLLRWTALPHFENDALMQVSQRAEAEEAARQRGGPEPTTVLVRGTVFDNPYMTEEARQENIKRWKAIGEDEYRKRALGELITDTVRMYPTFSADIHAVQRYGESHPHVFGEYLRTRHIPESWCLRLYVDPGFDTCAGLIIATPPTDEEVHVAVRELYLRQATPEKFVQALRDLLKGRWLQCNTMDAHGGALTSLADGRKPQEVFEQMMARYEVLSVETKHRFRAACDDIQYRETVLRSRLSIQASGMPQFLFDEEFCPNLLNEMVGFRKQRINGEVIDKGNRRVRTHLVECFEYAGADKLAFHHPPARRKEETPGQRRVRLYRERKARRKRKHAWQDGPAAGGIVLGAT